MIKILTHLFFYLLIFNSVIIAQMNLPIVPKPQIIKQTEGKFLIHNDLKIVINGKDKEKLLLSAEEIKNTLAEFLEINSTIAYNEKDGDIFLNQTERLKTDGLIPSDKIQEAYTLKIRRQRIEINSISSKRNLLWDNESCSAFRKNSK